jgi:hypothetical protein
VYHRLIGLVRSHRPDSIPDWLWNAVQGAAAANAGRPASAADITARLLTLTIHAASAQGQMVNNLVAAARAALAHTDDPTYTQSRPASRLRSTASRLLYQGRLARLATLACLPDSGQGT